MAYNVTHNPVRTYRAKPEQQRLPVFTGDQPEPMTPERVAATAQQFGQRVSKREARAISSVLIGWRGSPAFGKRNA